MPKANKRKPGNQAPLLSPFSSLLSFCPSPLFLHMIVVLALSLALSSLCFFLRALSLLVLLTLLSFLPPAFASSSGGFLLSKLSLGVHGAGGLARKVRTQKSLHLRRIHAPQKLGFRSSHEPGNQTRHRRHKPQLLAVRLGWGLPRKSTSATLHLRESENTCQHLAPF